MSRPKTGKPTKQRINLTVTVEVRNYLDQLSQIRKMSISEIISQYAEREIRKINRQQKQISTSSYEASTTSVNGNDFSYTDLEDDWFN